VGSYARLERRISRSGANRAYLENRYGLFWRQTIAHDFYLGLDTAIIFRDYESAGSDHEWSLLATTGRRFIAFSDQSTTTEIYFRRRYVETTTSSNYWYNETGVRMTFEF
jgi:hypothetical protein